jgi:hypothetical protein
MSITTMMFPTTDLLFNIIMFLTIMAEEVGPYTFQVILYKTECIYFQYLNMGAPLNSNTVGIENGAGNDGLQIALITPMFIIILQYK